MDKLKEAIKALVKEEYERAAQIHGKTFHSPHEAYAVIKEEVEEADFENDTIDLELSWLWENIKDNDTDLQSISLEDIEKFAINAACEYIQVAAMAYKARR